MSRRRHLAGVAAIAAVMASCSGGPTRPDGQPPPPPPPVVEGMLIGAGDIGDCNVRAGSESTARLLDRFPEALVFTAGDNAYPHGSRQDFRNCYDPTWGRHKSRTFPAPGNHEYETPGASAYFEYFGDVARGPDGYYSFDIGAWHILSLNSNTLDAAQLRWVRTDLTASNRRCTVAIYHHPLYGSGTNGNSRFVADLWGVLDELDVDVVINGHNHSYERFAPMDRNFNTSPRAPREFVVGTGGTTLTGFPNPQPNSLFKLSGVHGVLKLILRDGAYEWSFVRADNGQEEDRSGDVCH